MKQLILIVALICMTLIEAKRPMLKKNHPLYQYTSSSDKLGIPTISTAPRKPKKFKSQKKSKFNNKSIGPYANEDAAAANKTVSPPAAKEHP